MFKWTFRLNFSLQQESPKTRCVPFSSQLPISRPSKPPRMLLQLKQYSGPYVIKKDGKNYAISQSAINSSFVVLLLEFVVIKNWEMLFTSSRVFVFVSKSPKKISSRFYLSMGSRYHQHYANYAAIISHLISSEETHEWEFRLEQNYVGLLWTLRHMQTGGTVVQFPEMTATAPIK